jgi:predicted ATP-grasp superfamily ATP-dependent carboligase
LKALVLSADTPSACAVVRGLYAAGFEVVALAQSWHSPAAWSRCCARSRDAGAWKPDQLEALVASETPDVVVPVTEGDLVRLAPVRDAVARRTRIVAPPPESLDHAIDKAFTSKTAQSLGVAIPQQWILAAGNASAGAPDASFPLVAKPARSRVLRPDGTVRGATASYVADAAALREVHARNAAAGVDTIVQRIVPGAGVLVSVLVRETGDASLVFVHRRVREARPEGGPSACAESMAPDPRLVHPAVQMARALGVVGVPAQFEFRVDGMSAPVLLDVNPRPWGTLGLALDCGMNFYGLAARHATGDALPAPPPAYRHGVRRHYLPFELRRAFTVIFGTPQPGFPGPWPDTADAVCDWVFPPNAGLVGKLDDPLPAVGDAIRLLSRIGS